MLFPYLSTVAVYAALSPEACAPGQRHAQVFITDTTEPYGTPECGLSSDAWPGCPMLAGYDWSVVADQPPRAAFPTTRITLIEAACGEPTAEARDALSVLCAAYWYPIYAYIRRLGYRREDAEDMTQAFFTRVLEKQYLRDFERERGRFRSFLLVAVKHFVANERDWARARKRGGGATTLPLDAVLHQGERRYSLEPRHDLSPEKLFEQQWALAVLNLAQQRLRAEAERDGKAAYFERLKSSLTGDDLDANYRTIATQLNTTEGAIKVAVHRLRWRFRELLREEICNTIDDRTEVGNELRQLMAALRV